MCPDQQILSLYVDEELPSPWKEKFEAHLETCGHCQLRFMKYQKLRALLTEDRAEVPPEQKSRVWNRVIAGNAGEPRFSRGIRYSEGAGTASENARFWNRSVSLPVPAAAAAAAVFMMVSFLAINRIQFPGSPVIRQPAMAASVSSDTQAMPVSNMDDVLQYLSREDTSDNLVIRLPEARSFSSTGEPALVRAADYSRRTVSP